jgi:hypothetical protein
VSIEAVRKPRTAPERHHWAAVLDGAHHRLYLASCEAHGVSQSEAIRRGLQLWRESLGDRDAALAAWTERLSQAHGPRSLLTVRMNDDLELEVTLNGETALGPDEVICEVIFESADIAQAWVGDPKSDARAFLGRLVAGAAITVPVESIVKMGATDTHAV